MDLSEQLKDFARSPVGLVTSMFGSLLAAGHLTGTELVTLFTHNAGQWFGMVSVWAFSVQPYITDILEGTAPLRIVVVVLAGGAFLAVQLDKLVQKFTKRLQDR